MAIHLKDSNNTNGQDSFKIHSQIANTICQIIKNSDLSDCSFNMGLFGSWGSGKSFIINKIKEKLSDEYVFLNIDVWKFIGTPLLRSILFDINKQLKNNASDIFPDGYIENNRNLESILYYEEKLKNDIPISFQEQDKKIYNWFKCNKPYLIAMFSIIGLIFLLSICFKNELLYSLGFWGKLLNGLFNWNATFLGIIIGIVCVFLHPLKKLGELIYCGLEVQNYKTLPNFSPEQFERIFLNITNTISFNNKKLVIVFDNLDRCEPQFAYETLSTIKTFMDIKNCFYIVPCDDNAVKQYIVNNYSIINNDKKQEKKEDSFANTLGVEFFDKLFDTNIRIPMLEEIDRDKFIEEQLKQLTIYDELKDNIREIRQILYYGYKGSTPRQIKKFINDFSTYYLLAKNIDKSKQFLLKDIPFFAIMLVIKQKWNSIENKLVQVPELLHNAEINNDLFYDFIQKVNPLIPQPMPSLLPFIYLKETTNEQLVNEKLKYGEAIVEFDENIYKRINIEIENILLGQNNLYTLQAANSTFSTLVNNPNLDNNLRVDFIRTIGKVIASINPEKDFATFIIQNKDNLETFYKIINSMYLAEKEVIKSSLLDYLAEDEQEQQECQQKLFKLIIHDETDLFDSEEIQTIFANIESLSQVNNSIQNYVKLAFKNNKENYIPQKFIDFIFNSISTSGISTQAKNCLNIFNANKIPEASRKILTQKAYDLINSFYSRMSYGNSDIVNSLINAIDCLRLLYKKDFSDELYNSIVNLIYTILESLKTSNDIVRQENAYNLLIEMFWFVDDDKKFSLILKQYVDYNKERFIEKLKTKTFSYLEMIFELPESQKILLDDEEISNFIFNEYSEEIPQNYMLFLCQNCNINNLTKLLSTIKDKQIKLDKIKLRDDIVQKYISNDNITLTIEAFKTLNAYDYEVTKKQRLSIKNKLIDFYKTNPQNGIEQLKVMKELLNEDDYNSQILIPIFKYLDSELEITHSISTYTSILQVINESFIRLNINLIQDIINKLSDDNQDMLEYELCLGLIQLVKNTGLDIESFKEKLEMQKAKFNDKFLNQYITLYPLKDSNNIEETNLL